MSSPNGLETLQRVLGILGAVAAMIFTIVSMATMWVFSAASLANNTDPAAAREVGWWVLGFSLLCVAGVGAGIWLVIRGRPGWSAGTSLFPAAVMFLALVYQLLK